MLGDPLLIIARVSISVRAAAGSYFTLENADIGPFFLGGKFCPSGSETGDAATQQVECPDALRQTFPLDLLPGNSSSHQSF